mmetsp:Transcript_19532/g.56981  ORF Transcript_19532/g.56981 Transcript_19532/m.56981 type:complete len:481 (+) Transcript_19532:1756-3198(+)
MATLLDASFTGSTPAAPCIVVKAQWRSAVPKFFTSPAALGPGQPLGVLGLRFPPTSTTSSQPFPRHRIGDLTALHASRIPGRFFYRVVHAVGVPLYPSAAVLVPTSAPSTSPVHPLSLPSIPVGTVVCGDQQRVSPQGLPFLRLTTTFSRLSTTAREVITHIQTERQAADALAASCPESWRETWMRTFWPLFDLDERVGGGDEPEDRDQQEQDHGSEECREGAASEASPSPPEVRSLWVPILLYTDATLRESHAGTTTPRRPRGASIRSEAALEPLSPPEQFLGQFFYLVSGPQGARFPLRPCFPDGSPLPVLPPVEDSGGNLVDGGEDYAHLPSGTVLEAYSKYRPPGSGLVFARLFIHRQGREWAAGAHARRHQNHEACWFFLAEAVGDGKEVVVAFGAGQNEDQCAGGKDVHGAGAGGGDSVGRCSPDTAAAASRLPPPRKLPVGIAQHWGSKAGLVVLDLDRPLVQPLQRSEAVAR